MEFSDEMVVTSILSSSVGAVVGRVQDAGAEGGLRPHVGSVRLQHPPGELTEVCQRRRISKAGKTHVSRVVGVCAAVPANDEVVLTRHGPWLA